MGAEYVAGAVACVRTARWSKLTPHVAHVAASEENFKAYAVPFIANICVLPYLSHIPMYTRPNIQSVQRHTHGSTPDLWSWVLSLFFFSILLWGVAGRCCILDLSSILVPR